jgi:hypothetical protein
VIRSRRSTPRGNPRIGSPLTLPRKANGTPADTAVATPGASLFFLIFGFCKLFYGPKKGGLRQWPSRAADLT